MKLKKQFFYNDIFLNSIDEKIYNKIEEVLSNNFRENNYALKEIYYSNVIENNIAFENFADWKTFINDASQQIIHQKIMYKNSYQILNNLQKWMKHPFNELLILQFHQVIMGGVAYGGTYKTQNNTIIDETNHQVIYEPLVWILTHQAMEKMINNFNRNINKYDSTKKFILIIKFIFDFLCIHPFSDGNGRVSRLLFYWLIIKYEVIKDFQISISYRIWNDLENYYKVLQDGNKNWNTDNENLVPLIEYFIDLLRK